jgi:hypothetical protein
VQHAGEREADVAEPLHRHVHALEVAPEPVPHRRLKAEEDAARGEGRGVAAVARPAGDVRGRLRHHVHVGDRRADVLGGDVAPAEPLDRRPHRPHHRRRLAPAGRGHDDRLAAAERQAGERRLVAHAAAEPQHVGDCLGLGGVAPDPAAAERRAERGVVDRDDRMQPRGRVVREDDLLVGVEIRMVEDRCHGSPQAYPLLRSLTLNAI